MAPLSLPQHRAHSLALTWQPAPSPLRQYHHLCYRCIAAPALLSTAFTARALSCRLVRVDLPIGLVTQILLYVPFALCIDAHALCLVSSVACHTVLPVLYHNVRAFVSPFAASTTHTLFTTSHHHPETSNFKPTCPYTP